MKVPFDKYLSLRMHSIWNVDLKNQSKERLHAGY